MTTKTQQHFSTRDELQAALQAGHHIKHTAFSGSVFLKDGVPTRLLLGRETKAEYGFITPELWRIYIPPKWYDNIPEQGILCRVYASVDTPLAAAVIIAKYEDAYVDSIGLYWDEAIPMTQEEITPLLYKAAQ